MPVSESEVKQEIERFKYVKGERAQFESTWQEIIDYMLPDRGSITEKAKGQKTDTKIYDGTAIDALGKFASGIGGLLTNQALPWIDLEWPVDVLNDDEGAKKWLQTAVKTMDASVQDSNFYVQTDECYLDAGSIGTLCLFTETGKNRLLNFRSIFIADVYILENADGEVDTVFRSFKLTARQAKDKFSTGKLSDAVKSAGEAGSTVEKEYPFLHVVKPRSTFERDAKGNRKMDALNMPYASLYIDLTDNSLIEEGGYEEMPYAVARMRKFSRELYGRGPGWNALADVKMLNVMEETGIRAYEMATWPPMDVPSECYSLPLKMGPRGINFNNNWDDPNSRMTPINIVNPQNLDVYEKKAEQKRNLIREFFFVNQLQLINSPQMTATEVIQRTSENLKLVGPVLGRLQPEFLGVVANRIFGILLRAGKFPPLPDVVKQYLTQTGDLTLRVKYVSPIAKAQKLYVAQSIQQGLMAIGSMAAASPAVLDKPDWDKITEMLADYYSIPLLPTDKVKEIRRIRAEQQAKLAAMQETMAQASTMKDMSKVKTDEGLFAQAGEAA